MVELNNKLKLPIYTRFENYLTEQFALVGDVIIDTTLTREIVEASELSTFDLNVTQIKSHFNRVKKFTNLIVDQNFEQNVNIKLSGSENFSDHQNLIIKENTENKIVVNFDFSAPKSSNSMLIQACENSHTQLIIINNGTGTCSNFIKAEVAKNATLNVYVINSASNDLNDISIALNDTNASSHLKTVVIAKEAKKYFSVRIDHFAKNSFGRIVNHGIALENSHLIMNGFGKIHKDCKQSDNYQKTKLLALGETSRVEANPILLIDEYDVVASHAASVSNVDPAQLYYLKSRGIDSKNAQILLIKGFLKTIVNEINDEDVKVEFENTINEIIGYDNEI